MVQLSLPYLSGGQAAWRKAAGIRFEFGVTIRISNIQILELFKF
jgi:hypothetical protein